jgi:hypothetical protein
VVDKQTRGAAYAASVRAEFELNQSQQVLVDEIAATMDVLDGLSAGDVKEARAQRLILARMLGQLGLPDVGQNAGRQSATSTRARHAAESRWRQKAADRATS